MFNIISTFPEYDFFTHNFIQKNNLNNFYLENLFKDKLSKIRSTEKKTNNE